MAQEFTVSLQAIIDECKLEVIHTPQDPAKIFISNIDVNRPGLQLAGFYEYFDKGRIQIIGKAETAYLEQCGAEIRAQRIKKFFSEQPAAVVVSRGMDIMPEMRDLAKELDIPLGTVKWHLFEAKKELKRGMDTMRKTSELKFNPIKFSRIGLSGSSGKTGLSDYLHSVLSQNICYCVRESAKTVGNIADDLGVSPVYNT